MCVQGGPSSPITWGNTSNTRGAKVADLCYIDISLGNDLSFDATCSFVVFLADYSTWLN